MKNPVKALKIIRLRLIAWLSRLSPCLAMRWGIVGILAAEVTSGLYKGMPLGVALAVDKIRKETT